MPLTNENWQTTKSTIRERTKFMLNNELFSDVKFVVRKSDGENESKQVIPAHKFVLSIGSPVFEAMFYGGLAETRDSIELPDCEYESLLELFRYMYSDEANLSGSNVMGVLYLAKKYMVPSLAEKCTEYLQTDLLVPSNVFSILPSALKYEENNLVDRCWELIDKQTEAVVKSDGFATLERPLLEALVERDTLDIAEVELFNGVVEWATKESEKRGIVADGKEKRRIIGERIVKALRFPVMKQEEFLSVVIDSKILTYDEVANVSNYFNSVQSRCVGFLVTKRSGPSSKLIRCRRFNSVKFGWKNLNAKIIFFSSDLDILFHGVNMFGSKDNAYSVTLELCLFTGKLYSDVLASARGKFPSVVDASGQHYCFDVLFKKPIPLNKGLTYCLEASVMGPDSWYGIRGCHTYLCAGVTITLIDDHIPDEYKIETTRGQFNEFIFSIRK